MKLTRITQAIKAFATAALCAVLPTHAAETMKAPRATVTAQCLTAVPGCEKIVAEYQREIAALREAGYHLQAENLFDYMTTNLMVEKWVETKGNLVVTVGKNDLLDKYLSGSAYTAAWFLGLMSSVSYTTGVAAGDTMASHGGWTEAGPTNAPNYDSATRPSVSFAAASGGAKATSAAVSFTFNGGGTIKGCFLTSNSTKDGTTGILYNAVLFTGGDRAVVDTDVVNVSLNFTA